MAPGSVGTESAILRNRNIFQTAVNPSTIPGLIREPPQPSSPSPSANENELEAWQFQYRNT